MKRPQKPPAVSSILATLDDAESLRRVVALWTSGIGAAPEGRYRHWETLRFITPPHGITSEWWWVAIKMARDQMRRPIPLLDVEGAPFYYTLADPLLKRLHRVDRDGSGRIALPEAVTNPDTRDRYVISSLMEEAITSSQLEGAATTREVAKAMLRSGRDPRTKGERMIANNFRAMQHLREWKDEPLTPAFVQRLHRVLTEGTLEDPEHAFRRPGDGIGVYSNDDNTLLHAPPHASEIPARLDALCDFANHAETGVFLHPAIKAIILHFWLAYDHPFVDGNGRTARALFYWYMLRSGFWLFEFVSISSILRRAPARYARAFLYTETDENDLTYFLLAQLRVIEQALDSLQAHLARKAQAMQDASRLLRGAPGLNHRQQALLAHALEHPGFAYTFASHRTSHGVVYQTARTDLLDLEARHLLDRRKVSKAYVFIAPSDLAQRVRESAQ